MWRLDQNVEFVRICHHTNYILPPHPHGATFDVVREKFGEKKSADRGSWSSELFVLLVCGWGAGFLWGYDYNMVRDQRAAFSPNKFGWGCSCVIAGGIGVWPTG